LILLNLVAIIHLDCLRECLSSLIASAIFREPVSVAEVFSESEPESESLSANFTSLKLFN